MKLVTAANSESAGKDEIMGNQRKQGNIKRVWMTALIVLGGVVLITIGLMRSNLNFYMTISELKELDNAEGSKVRVIGEIVKGSWTPEGDSGYSFILRDGDEELRCYYRGAGVDVAGGRQIVVEGAVDADGVFQSDKIITRCESRYSGKGGRGTRR